MGLKKISKIGLSIASVVLLNSTALAQFNMPAVNSAVSTLPAAPAENIANPKTTLQFSTNLRAASSEDKLMNSKYAGGIFGITAEQTFNSYLSGEFDVSLLITTGTLTKQYNTSEGGAPNGFLLGKALLNLKPFSYTSVQFGVLDVEFSSVISSFDGQGFPGVREVVEATSESQLKLKLMAAQTIPTSGTPEVKTSEDGITTRLDIYNIEASTNADGKQDLTLKVSGTYFQFQNLTSSAATDSQYLGNSVTQVGSQARFKYQFEGTEASGNLEYKFSNKYKTTLFGSQLINQKAPSGQNKAQFVSMGNTLMTNNVNYTLSVGAFNNDSDALPASFTSSRYSNSNRFGWTALFKTELEKQKTSFFGRFVQANEEQDISYQADRQSVFLGMEAKYDIL